VQVALSFRSFAFDTDQVTDVQYLEPPNFHQQAFDMAERLDRPVAYDAHYLGCEFWTADERLVNVVQEILPWVKWLGTL
jgi:predicted nucleic acid-binding protein